jgi:GGDEF domain-containing protein
VLLVETSAHRRRTAGDTLRAARGDEFAILLENVDDAGMSEAVRRACSSARAPVTVEARRSRGVSIGIANSAMRRTRRS